MTIIRKSWGGFVMILVVVPLLLVNKAATANFDPSDQLSSSEIYDQQRKATVVKRPFCNAFTGCGRKRSELLEEVPEESLNNKALREISQQIMQMLVNQRRQDLQNRNKVPLRSSSSLPVWDFPAERKRRMVN